MDLAEASKKTPCPLRPEVKRKQTLIRKAVELYKAGAPISVITTSTGLSDSEVNKIVDAIHLSKEELALRNELLSTYTQNVQAQITQRQERRSQIELEIVEAMGDKFKGMMNNGFAKVAQFMKDEEITSIKEVPVHLSIMERSHKLWEAFNTAIEKRDLNMLTSVIQQFELEQTETITQMGLQEGPITLNKDGTRPEIKEESAARTITLKLKKKGEKPETDVK